MLGTLKAFQTLKSFIVGYVNAQPLAADILNFWTPVLQLLKRTMQSEKNARHILCNRCRNYTPCTDKAILESLPYILHINCGTCHFKLTACCRHVFSLWRHVYLWRQWYMSLWSVIYTLLLAYCNHPTSWIILIFSHRTNIPVSPAVPILQ